MLSHHANANQIQYGVATSVTPTYNTTNASNKCNVLCNEPAVLLYTQPLLVLYQNNADVKFLPVTMSFPIHVTSMFHL